MKLFRNPVFAVLLSLVLVVGSTVISSSLKLSRRAEKAAGVFYEGSERLPSAATDISCLCADGEVLSAIAANYGINVQELIASGDSLKKLVNSRSEDYPELYRAADRFCSAYLAVETALQDADLSDTHRAQLQERSEDFAALVQVLADAGADYNSGAQKFRRDFSRFPAGWLMELFGIQYPEFFVG